MKLNNKNGHHDEYVRELVEASNSLASFIVNSENALEALGINLYEKDGVICESTYQLLKEIAQKWKEEVS